MDNKESSLMSIAVFALIAMAFGVALDKFCTYQCDQFYIQKILTLPQQDLKTVISLIPQRLLFLWEINYYCSVLIPCFVIVLIGVLIVKTFLKQFLVFFIIMNVFLIFTLFGPGLIVTFSNQSDFSKRVKFVADTANDRSILQQSADELEKNQKDLYEKFYKPKVAKKLSLFITNDSVINFLTSKGSQ